MTCAPMWGGATSITRNQVVHRVSFMMLAMPNETDVLCGGYACSSNICFND